MYKLIASFHWARPSKWPLFTLTETLKALQASRCLSNITSKLKNDTRTEDSWQIIYHMPLAGLAAGFNHLKVPYGLGNVIGLPVAFALEQAHILPPEAASVMTAIGLSSWLTLAICSFASSNLIGFVYMNEQGDRIRLAYVDYWGKRQESIVPAQDIAPYRDLPFFFNTKLVTVHQPKDKPIKFKILPRFGHIKDHFAFSAIFGG